jgi:TolB-like protein
MWMRAILTLSLLAAAVRAEAAPAVTVLYFDNDTGDATYEPLGKGLADMMVTDLSSVDGIEVVEREKLEAVLQELRLQREKYFDPKTAQKIGKGIGAEYAVTGAFVSVAPDLRIDVRVIRIATGQVVKANKVVGKKDRFFALQEELVKALAEGLAGALSIKGKPTATPKDKVDLSTAVAYGKGLDLRDSGDLKAASQQMQQVMQTAPGFTLARSRYMQIMKQLYAAKDKRSEVLKKTEAELLERIDKRIASDDKQLGTRGNSLALNWRMTVPIRALRSELMLRRLADRFDAPRRELKKALEDYLDNQHKLLEHQLQFMDKGHYAFGYGLCHQDDWRPMCISNQDLERAGDLVLADPMRDSHYVEGHQILQDMHALVMFGDRPYFSAVKLPRRVCFSQLDPAYPARALKWLDRAIELIEGYDPEQDARWLEDEKISLRIQRAQHMVLTGKPEEAIASLQDALTRFPKAKRFAEVEGLLKSVLAGENKWANGRPFVATCQPPP